MLEKKFAGNWTLTKLRDLSPRKRFEVRENTKNTRLIDERSRTDLLEAIDESGPLYDSSAITADDPLALQMDEIINSADGRAACLRATAEGWPALAGVEPEIVSEVGDLYGQKYMATHWAGYQVGTLMKSLGYEEIGKRKMPEGSVAKTAAYWRRKR